MPEGQNRDPFIVAFLCASPCLCASVVNKHATTALILVGLICGTLILTACSTPHERYKVLSTFFDGVPDPDAPKKIASTQPADPDAPANGSVVTLSIVSIHKPYRERQCDACHFATNGEIQDFEKAYDSCLRCHKKVTNNHTLMHGPVARAACRFCHSPHESTQPHLLKDTSIKVCTQCHDSQLLGNKPIQHIDGKTSCLQCHTGHGGEVRFFLVSKTNATTQPATQPSTQPATQPTTRFSFSDALTTAPTTQPATQNAKDHP